MNRWPPPSTSTAPATGMHVVPRGCSGLWKRSLIARGMLRTQTTKSTTSGSASTAFSATAFSATGSRASASRAPATAAQLNNHHMDDDDDTLKSNSGNTDPPSNPRAILQMGRAIDVLRRELPFLFDCGLQDWSIYHERVQLSEGQHYRFHVRGLWLYRRFLGAARHVLQFYFSDLEFRVRSVTQQHVEGGTGFVTDTSSTSREHGRDAIPAVEVVVRWTLEGTPKPSLLWRNVTLSAQRTLESLPESVVGPSSTVGSSTNSSGTSNNGNAAETASQNPSLIRRSIYEGMFVYRFDPTTGLIIEHRVENVVPAPFAKFAPLRAIGWWQQRGKLSLVD